MLAEVNDRGDPVGVGDRSALLLEVETGEDVTGKHRLMEEDFTSLGRFVIADPWAEGLDVLKLA